MANSNTPNFNTSTLIGVIGSGTMGNGIAHVFAQHGFSVSLVDVSEDALKKALQTITKNLARQVEKEVITEAVKTTALQNITTYTNLKTGVQDAGLVIEAASENQELKLKIFQDLDRYTPPQTILASNTSSISITKIAAATNRQDKVIGMHFMNPVPIMKLVEIINGYATKKEVTDTIVDLCKIGRAHV